MINELPEPPISSESATAFEDGKHRVEIGAELAAIAIAAAEDPEHRSKLLEALNNELQTARVFAVDAQPAEANPEEQPRRGKRSGKTREEVLHDLQLAFSVTNKRIQKKQKPVIGRSSLWPAWL